MINKSQKRKADVIMYIVFIDESGQPGGYNEQKQEFNKNYNYGRCKETGRRIGKFDC